MIDIENGGKKMKEQIISIITLIIFLIGAFFCYKKVQRIDTIDEKQNSFLYVNSNVPAFITYSGWGSGPTGDSVVFAINQL